MVSTAWLSQSIIGIWFTRMESIIAMIPVVFVLVRSSLIIPIGYVEVRLLLSAEVETEDSLALLGFLEE